ncbi:putative bifunctional diguanylate cyclase/phosphodiesterase [Micromonosporaceae bacterium Da 78-11]
MRQGRLDSHAAEFWARQLRIGASVAAVITLLGGIRIGLDWPAPLRWWAIPVFVAAGVQAATVLLPWLRWVPDPRFRRWLLLWWFGEMPVLLLFGLGDADGIALYMPGAMLLMISASALWDARTVLLLGVLAVLGYCVLLPAQADLNPIAGFVLVAMQSCVVMLTTVNAQSRRRLDQRRRSAEHRTEALLEASSDAVLAIAADGRLHYVSPSVHQLLGHRAEDMHGHMLAGLVHADQLPHVRDFMSRLFEAPDGQTLRSETRLLHADGHSVYVDVIGRNRTDDPDLRAAVVSLRDIGARRALEEKLSRQAFTDSLTGMPNRALFRKRLGEAVAGSGGRPVTVLLLDLDDFKLVNDNLGHNAGDELLTTIAERLRGQVRPVDTLARLGGDEFAILLDDLRPADAAAFAERLLGVVRQPIRLASRDITCSLSIGIATSIGDDDRVPAEQLLGNADLAMYAAKRAGRNAYAVFDPTMTMSVLQEAQQRADLEHGLAADEFVVHYQPVVDMHTRHLTAVEALVRWRHPRDGLLGPYHFIADAEANGLIVPLGRWVLRQACTQLARWRAETPQAAELTMNVNLSARQFQYAGLVDDVATAIADAGIDAGSLTLEITESMLMADIDAAKQTLLELRALGVHLAIDDFGTGYSSLSYLKQLPVDVIKIDKSFVDQVDTDADDVALVDAVVGLSQALKMKTVAEGIETDEQWLMLRRIGIDHGQGYLFGRPGEPAAILALLDRVPV